MKKFISALILLVFIFLAQTAAIAQVTIGSLQEPIQGALLDLKDQLPNAENVTSTTGGLLLPRVELRSLNDFSLTQNPTEEEKKNHIGLLVYNLKIDESLSLEKGIHQWDGKRWRTLSKVTKTESVVIKKKIYPANSADSTKTVSIGIFEFRMQKKKDNRDYPQFRLNAGVPAQIIYWHVNEYYDLHSEKESINIDDSGYSFVLKTQKMTSSWTDCMNSMSDKERNEVWLADLTNNHMYQIHFIIIQNASFKTYSIIAKRY